MLLPFGLTPAEAVAFFRRKGYHFSFDWRDMAMTEHAKAFTVAKVMRADLLEDIRAAVDGAIAEGRTLDEFKQALTPLLQQQGWWGKQLMVDAKDGREKLVQLGSPRRLETIYDTNLRTSYAAGRWEQIQRTKDALPYLRYVHHPTPHPRRQHLAWNNLVLRVDDPFWRTHYPPNGWHCHCTVQQLAAEHLEQLGLRESESPKIDYVTYRNARTGEARQVPDGIDPGFDYNPGIVSLQHYRDLLAQRVNAAPPDLREALAS